MCACVFESLCVSACDEKVRVCKSLSVFSVRACACLLESIPSMIQQCRSSDGGDRGPCRQNERASTEPAAHSPVQHGEEPASRGRGTSREPGNEEAGRPDFPKIARPHFPVAALLKNQPKSSEMVPAGTGVGAGAENIEKSRNGADPVARAGPEYSN